MEWGTYKFPIWPLSIGVKSSENLIVLSSGIPTGFDSSSGVLPGNFLVGL